MDGARGFGRGSWAIDGSLQIWMEHTNLNGARGFGRGSWTIDWGLWIWMELADMDGACGSEWRSWIWTRHVDIDGACSRRLVLQQGSKCLTYITNKYNIILVKGSQIDRALKISTASCIA